MQDAPKAVWSIPYVSVSFFPSLKQNFIAYRSSKVSSRPDCIFEIHQPWESGFCRVYCDSCSSCSFELEIIKIGQSSYKMYSNNNFKCQYKKSQETYWMPHIFYIYIYIYIYIVIPRKTVSLYHNNAVWLDMKDTSSWDRNPPNFTLDMLYNHAAISVTYVSSGIIMHIVLVYLQYCSQIPACSIR